MVNDKKYLNIIMNIPVFEILLLKVIKSYCSGRFGCGAFDPEFSIESSKSIENRL